VVLKGPVVGSQAERLVKVRREVTRAEEMTRMEQLESEARQKADGILSAARTQAEDMLSKAKIESESIRKKAREDGDLTAKREALEKIAGLIKSLENEVQGLKAVRSDFLRRNLSGIVDFACSLAEKVLVYELRTRPELVAQRAQALLERMPPGTQVTMAVSPDDLDVIERYLNSAGGPAGTLRPALQSDPSIQTGCIRLESDLGRIEARLLDELNRLGNILSDQALHQSGLKDTYHGGADAS
jgi:flagellar biosynthesis/type III secretory pathway protein FliH